MRNCLERSGCFTLRDIHEAFGTKKHPRVPANSINGDLKALENVGYALEKIKLKEENTTQIRWKGSRAFTVKHSRRKMAANRKKLIAEATASFVCGLEVGEIASAGLNAKATASRTAFRSFLDQEYPDLTHEVMDKIYSFWASPFRTLALDSGTSTDAVAEALKNLKTPNERFTHMNVWTNSRSVFGVLGQPECQIKTIMIGGEQRFLSESVSGDLAQKCIEAWDPHFGAAIIGATAVDIVNAKVEAYNDSEATIKSTLLSRAALKIIIADATKFSFNPVNSGARFSVISPKFVDLIIVDTHKHPSVNREIPKSISGVPILASDSIFGCH